MKITKSKFTKQSLLTISRLVFGIYLGFRVLNLGFISPVHAQSVGLSVSPPVVEILLAPNKKLVQTFTLKNQGQTVNIVASLHSIKPAGESGQVSVDPLPLNPSSIPLLVTLSPVALATPLELAEGATQTLSLTLEGTSVETSVDTYFALVITPTLASTIAPSPDQTISTPSISSLVLTTLTPTGIMPAALEISGFDLPLFHDSSQSFSIYPTLTNHSDIMIRPEGMFTILSPSGKTAFEQTFYPNLLLKQSSRQIQGGDTHTSSSIQNTPSSPIPLSWSPTFKNLGPHRLRLTVTTIGGTKLTEVEKVVWFLPIRLIALSIVLLICVLAILLSRNKHKLGTHPIDNP